MSRRVWFILLRTLVAVAGLGYIAYTLNWVDQVSVEAGSVLAGVAITEDFSVPLTDAQIREARRTGELAIEIPLDAPSDRRVAVLAWPITPDQAPAGVEWRPGIVRTLVEADRLMLLAGLALMSLIYPIQLFRWMLLLRARQLDVPVAKAFRLLMVGSFFNFCMPGTTGGDVIKAYYAARNSKRRADSVMTVIADRAAGLLGLVVVALAAGAATLHHPIGRNVALATAGLLLALVIGAILYLSTRFRRLIRFEQILTRLPGERFLRATDRAAVAFRDHPRTVAATVLISVLNHLVLIVSTALGGWALGLGHPLILLLTVLPLVMLAASAPLTYQGLGVMEGIALPLLLHAELASANQIVGMLLLTRLYQIVYAMLGSVFLLKGDIHLHPEQSGAVDPASPDAADSPESSESSPPSG